MKEALFGKTLSELKALVAQLKLPAYSARQIANWLYQNNVTRIDEMTNLSKTARKLLKEKYEIGRVHPAKVQVSNDGTKKYLFHSAGQRYVEAAYIPEKERNTLCVSSQVGCKMGCTFCMTGKQGFQANLTAGEILNQIWSLPEKDDLTNIVYMGMGEPLDNPVAVMNSLDILTADWGLDWSPKRITVSTIGIIPALREFIEKNPCHLAISLHTPFDEERRKLMPVENVYPLKDVLELLKQYDFKRQRRVSFEYIMFKDLNDTSRHVNELVRILHGIKCRVNLIRFHPVPGIPLLSPDDQTILSFREKLNAKGITTTIRASRGLDIHAACGLLSTKELVARGQ